MFSVGIDVFEVTLAEVDRLPPLLVSSTAPPQRISSAPATHHLDDIAD
jgi:hypothetical protein